MLTIAASLRLHYPSVEATFSLRHLLYPPPPPRPPRLVASCMHSRQSTRSDGEPCPGSRVLGVKSTSQDTISEGSIPDRVTRHHRGAPVFRNACYATS